ncbi:hypothetical protein CY34DRAFT_806063 [Suillus luteus UH-Slu-Lm8-n1]|uniref:Uncharacterized protein n=1 Tax=Suillus luteus UH-Slu-Lm8-n1 TaxID=930992 RepID=A0A0D0BDS1_9AGAM|nr:hypothetical protein CY34DRAFT_806063 [Suillus luteus UH-Slu-Lm8-n1]
MRFSLSGAGTGLACAKSDTERRFDQMEMQMIMSYERQAIRKTEKTGNKSFGAISCDF